MAILQTPKRWLPNFGWLGLAPAGVQVGRCLEIVDWFGVERPKHDQPELLEKIDMTCFLFGIVDSSGQPHLVQTAAMKITMDQRSNLWKILSRWLGKPPEAGWDYCELKGQPCLVTVTHRAGKTTGQAYAAVAAADRLPAAQVTHAPKAEVFAPLIAAMARHTKGATGSVQAVLTASAPPLARSASLAPPHAPSQPPGSMGSTATNTTSLTPKQAAVLQQLVGPNPPPASSPSLIEPNDAVPQQTPKVPFA